MLSSIQDLLFAFALPRHDAVAFYDRLAPRYDRLHKRWLRAGGAESIMALRGCLIAELRPGARLLDAGCGTGQLARWIIEQEPHARVTLLDAAPEMLDRASVSVERKILGDLLDLPLASEMFDIVVCTWALETVNHPARALLELQRVLAPGGLLCCCYCSQPQACLARWRTLAVRSTVTHVFKGRFLNPAIGGALGSVRWISAPDRLSTFLCYRKPSDENASRA
jgi:ubiquinone/menaquinone biosynthesis C-methylase UbiE